MCAKSQNVCEITECVRNHRMVLQDTMSNTMAEDNMEESCEAWVLDRLLLPRWKNDSPVFANRARWLHVYAQRRQTHLTCRAGTRLTSSFLPLSSGAGSCKTAGRLQEFSTVRKKIAASIQSVYQRKPSLRVEFHQTDTSDYISRGLQLMSLCHVIQYPHRPALRSDSLHLALDRQSESLSAILLSKIADSRGVRGVHLCEHIADAFKLLLDGIPCETLEV
jgi:hypothetical protein